VGRSNVLKGNKKKNLSEFYICYDISGRQ